MTEDGKREKRAHIKSDTIATGDTVVNALSFDVEDWFHICDIKSLDLNEKNWDMFESRVMENTTVLLGILKSFNVKATFFFVGWVAEKFPELVINVKKAGHEIGIHGYYHKLIYEQTKDEFIRDLEMSMHVIKEIVGEQKVFGYRGPGFSLKKQSMWALDIIAKEGFSYDSTMFPGKRGHGGILTDRIFPHQLELEGGFKLWEFPISIIKIAGFRIPFSGGGYLRLLPYWFIRNCITRINKKGKPVLVYMHPREIDLYQPKMPLPLVRRFKYYVNLKSTRRKLETLLSEFSFAPIKDVLNL